jgi:hypothetical protein
MHFSFSLCATHCCASAAEVRTQCGTTPWSNKPVLYNCFLEINKNQRNNWTLSWTHSKRVIFQQAAQTSLFVADGGRRAHDDYPLRVVAAFDRVQIAFCAQSIRGLHDKSISTRIQPCSTNIRESCFLRVGKRFEPVESNYLICSADNAPAERDSPFPSLEHT